MRSLAAAEEDKLMPDEPAPLYCAAYRRLRRQSQNGHMFSLAEIEAAVEADPPTRKVFAQMAAETRAGRDISIEEFALRAHVPPAFVVFLVQAFIAGFVDALAASATS